MHDKEQGFFPQSTVGDERLANEEFCFVNLDFDLYQPIQAGLEFFYPKLVRGGMILVHDYFSWSCRGANDAVNKWCDATQVSCSPIGDGMSVAIIKQ
jgi:hypothetical protein